MADDMNLEAEIDTALAGGSPEAVVEAGPAAVAPLAARLASAKTTGEKSALVDLLSAVGGADALAPVLPYIRDADPDLRARGSHPRRGVARRRSAWTSSATFGRRSSASTRRHGDAG